MIEPHPVEFLAQALRTDRAPRLRPRHRAAGPVRARAQGGRAAAAHDVVARRAHRAGDDAGLVEGRRVGALAVDPQRAIAVDLGAHEVVVTLDDRRGIGIGPELAAQYVERDLDHPRATGRRIRQSPRDVGEIGAALVGVRGQSLQPDPAGVLQVRGADRRSQSATTRVDHQPQAPRVVGLQLDEVVAAAERPELQRRLASPQRRELGRSHVGVAQRRRQPRRVASRVAHHRDRARDPVEHPRGRGRVREGTRVHAELDRRHPAADVATDRGGEQRAERGQHHADADLLGEVHVGHHRDVRHVGRAQEPIERGADVRRRRRVPPRVECRGFRGHRRHPRAPRPGAVTT